MVACKGIRAGCIAKELALLALCMASHSRASAQVAATPSTVAVGPIGRRLDSIVRRAEVLGFSGQVLVASDGKVILHGAYGIADRTGHRPFSITTPVGVGSVSKLFTAAAILRLMDQGRLALSDTLGALLPAVPATWASVTVQELLVHGSGAPGGTVAPRQHSSLGDVVIAILAGERANERRGVWQYSTEGYVLLAAIVERISGRPYRDFVRSELLEPAGMHQSWFVSDTLLPEELANAYVGWSDRGRPDQRLPDWRATGSGDLITTASDLYRWSEAVRQRRILSDSAWQRYQSPYLKITDGFWSGHGPQVRGEHQLLGPGIEHGGDDLEGYNAFLGIYRNPQDITLVITSNARDADGRWYRGTIGSALEAALDDSGATPADDTPPLTFIGQAQRAELAGTWIEPSTGTRLEMRDTGGPILLIASGQPALDLVAGTSEPGASVANARVRRMLDRLFRNAGAESFAELTATDATATRSTLASWWGGYLGASREDLIGAAVLGTRTIGEWHWTYVRLQFSREWRVFRIGSRDPADPMIGRLEPDRLSEFPLVRPIGREADGTFRAEDPFNGEAFRFVLRRDVAGEWWLSPVDPKSAGRRLRRQ